MTINLSEIYAGLKAYRHERGLTAQNQKSGYIVNVMEEIGELAEALRDYEKIKNGEQVIKKYIASEWVENNAKYALIKYKKVTLADAEYSIIDALCDISVFTINAGADIPCEYKPYSIETSSDLSRMGALASIFYEIRESYFRSRNDDRALIFGRTLVFLATICESYGYNFEIAMIETIKEISSRTGSYDEVAKKWVKDTSDEAKAKWYKADFEKARILKWKIK